MQYEFNEVIRKTFFFVILVMVQFACGSFLWFVGKLKGKIIKIVHKTKNSSNSTTPSTYHELQSNRFLDTIIPLIIVT